MVDYISLLRDSFMVGGLQLHHFICSIRVWPPVCVSQFGLQRIQNAAGGQRPVVPEEARQLGGDGPQTPPGVEEGAGQGQEVSCWRADGHQAVPPAGGRASPPQNGDAAWGGGAPSLWDQKVCFDVASIWQISVITYEQIQPDVRQLLPLSAPQLQRSSSPHRSGNSVTSERAAERLQ